MKSSKIVQFSRPPTPLVHLCPKFFRPLELGCPNEPLLTNQLKENIIQGWLLLVMTSFHVNEVSVSAFSWLYSLTCAVVQKYQICTFLVLILQSICFIFTTWKRKQTMGQQTHLACEQTKSKPKQNQLMSYSNWPCVLLFGLAGVFTVWRQS